MSFTANIQVQPGSAADAGSKSSAYDDAAKAIAAGEAEGRALWVLLSDEHQRDGHWLKPMPWEGSGEYQHVRFADGRDGFVRIPNGKRSLRTSWGKSAR